MPKIPVNIAVEGNRIVASAGLTVIHTVNVSHHSQPRNQEHPAPRSISVVKFQSPQFFLHASCVIDKRFVDMVILIVPHLLTSVQEYINARILHPCQHVCTEAVTLVPYARSEFLPRRFIMSYCLTGKFPCSVQPSPSFQTSGCSTCALFQRISRWSL